MLGVSDLSREGQQIKRREKGGTMAKNLGRIRFGSDAGGEW